VLGNSGAEPHFGDAGFTRPLKNIFQMKKLLTALAIGLMAYTGAQAQICKPKTIRHKAAVHRAPLQATETKVTSCRMVPFQVCSINADRRSVTCYKTTDPENIAPLNSETTQYGPTGDLPGEPQQSTVKTVVIRGKTKGNYCRRNDDQRAVVCFDEGLRLVRDDDGYYSYR